MLKRNGETLFAVLLVLSAFIGMPASAAPIGLGDFSGSETVVDLGNLPGPSATVVTVDDLTFTSSTPFLKQSGLTDTSVTGMFTMDLASPQQRVGLELNQFFDNPGLVTWSIQAFDIGLNFLEEVFVSQSVLSTPVFGGLERIEGISRLLVTEVTPCVGCNYFTFINEARFENTGPSVPEPTALGLLGLGLAGLGLASRRKLGA